MSMRHNVIRNLLYDVLTGTATADDRRAVEQHVAQCRRCAVELEELKKTLTLLGPLNIDLDSVPPDGFWQQFARSVDDRIATSVKSAPSFAEEWDNLLSWLVGRQRWVVAMSASAAVVVVALLFWSPFSSPAPGEIAQSNPDHGSVPATGAPATAGAETSSGTPAELPQAIQVRARAADYFRKSKVLLVGFSNMKTDPNQPVDISAEQQLSRQLVHEASYLKGQRLDFRSVRLVGDLDRVMTALSNAKQTCDVPTVETIQNGIHRSNLLFKIRMAESMYDTTR
jgi:anti-sigma factor RsiW